VFVYFHLLIITLEIAGKSITIFWPSEHTLPSWGKRPHEETEDCAQFYCTDEGTHPHSHSHPHTPSHIHWRPCSFL